MRRARTVLACLAAAVLGAAGCAQSPADRFGVNLFVDATAVAPTDRDRATRLDVHVEGAEQYDTMLDLSSVADKSQLTLHYVPLVHAGAIGFALAARAADGSPIAAGSSAAIELVDGHAVEVHVQLKVGVTRHVGEACTSPDDLCDGAGGCVDGVCCNTACAAACMACDVAGIEGVCAPLPAGQMPRAGHAACDASPSTSCGLDGACDGTGACRRWPLGTTCGASSCDVASNLFVAAGECDGAGTCVSSPPLPCDPYRCKDTTQCYPSCTDSSQCTGSPPTCNTAVTPGSCGPKPNGATCAQNAECQSGHCVEPDGTGTGICCDTACTTTCTSCRIAATRGKCSIVPAGQDPLAQCPASAGAAAACVPGGCDGTLAKCKINPTSTQCRAPACAASQQSAAVTCAADGTCATAPTSACDPYVCGATACKTTCTVDGDCQTGTCRGGKCATYGGAYLTNANPSCTSACNDGNPLAAATSCACPTGFSVGSALGSYNDCAPSGTFTTSTLSFCQRAARTTQSDWGGAYATYPAGCGVSTTNPYTTAASCPSDTVATTYSFYLAACDKSATLTLCTSMTAPTVTFAGAYEKDDDVGQGMALLCRTPNPRTGSCTCPMGTSPAGLRVIVDRRPASPGIIGSHLFVCMP